MEKRDTSELDSVKRTRKQHKASVLFTESSSAKFKSTVQWIFQSTSENEIKHHKTEILKHQRSAEEWPEGLDDEADRTGPPAQATESGHIRRAKRGKKNHKNCRAKELAAKNKNKDEAVDPVKLEDESIDEATTGQSVKHDDDDDCSNQI